MRPDSKYPVVNISDGLWRIMKEPHNRRRFGRLILEKVFRKIQSEGE